MKKILLILAVTVLGMSSCSDYEMPPNIDDTTWDLYYFLDPPGIPGSALITLNADGKVTSVPASASTTWAIAERTIVIKYPGNIEYRGQLKSEDTLMSGTIYKAGSPNGFWSAERQ